jgi:hypothetical protein
MVKIITLLLIKVMNHMTWAAFFSHESHESCEGGEKRRNGIQKKKLNTGDFVIWKGSQYKIKSIDQETYMLILENGKTVSPNLVEKVEENS